MVSNTTMHLRHIVITNFDELSQYEDVWRLLTVDRANASLLCLDWEWLYQWCALYLLPNDRLAIKIFFDGEKAVGIFPFYIKVQGLSKVLRFIGTGEDESIEVCSEFQDIIALPSYESLIIKCLKKYLLTSKDFNQVCFEHIVQESIIFQSTSSNTSFRSTSLGLRFLFPIVSEEREQINHFAGKTLKRQARKSQTSACLRFEVAANEHAVNNTFEQLKTIHNQMWKSRGKVGAFEAEEFELFHQRFVKKMFLQDRLIMFSIYYREVLVGAYYGIISGDSLYYYQSGMKRDVSSQYIGVAMHLKAIELARSKNLKFYDLMTGKKSSYKANYKESNIEVFTVKAYRFPHNYLSLLGRLVKKLVSINSNITNKD